MTTKNLIKNNNKFDKEYLATVVSNEDPLKRGRLLVIVESLLGENPFWVDSSLTGGKIRLLLIPEKDDIITVKFRNKDIYSGVWELKGSPINGTDEDYIDPKKYGLIDNQGNYIIIDRRSNSIAINTKAFTITSNDSFVEGNFGTSIGATEMIPLPNGTVLSFVNGIFIGSSS